MLTWNLVEAYSVQQKNFRSEKLLHKRKFCGHSAENILHWVCQQKILSNIKWYHQMACELHSLVLRLHWAWYSQVNIWSGLTVWQPFQKHWLRWMVPDHVQLKWGGNTRADVFRNVQWCSSSIFPMLTSHKTLATTVVKLFQEIDSGRVMLDVGDEAWQTCPRSPKKCLWAIAQWEKFTGPACQHILTRYSYHWS
jgi:hypothetical protein